MNSVIKKAVGWLLGEYRLYRIYSLACADAPPVDSPGLRFSPLDSDDRDHAAGEEIRGLFNLGGTEAAGFGAWKDDKVVAACWLWWGGRYETRGFWPLGENEAKLVELMTDPAARGLGVAPALLRYASAGMGGRGFKTLHARIWHNHKASINAFEKAGWVETAFVAEFHFFGRAKPSRWVRKRKAD